MKKKFLVASHGNLANGIKSSLDILAGCGEKIEVINAYINDEDYTEKIIQFISSISNDEQGIIFTDLYGGSVNQKVLSEVINLNKNNIFIISNSNLAIVLSLIFYEEELTEEILDKIILESQVKLVATKLEKSSDDDFFND